MLQSFDCMCQIVKKSLAQLTGAVEYTDCISVDFPNECPEYDIRQSDGKAPVMLEFWGMWSTSSLLLLPGPLWPKVVASNKDSIYRPNRIFYIQTVYFNI